MTLQHELSLITHLRCFHKTLSGSGIDELLHFDIVILNSSLEKGFYFNIGLKGSLSKMLILIWQFWVELNN